MLLLRRLHRWVSTVIGLFLLVMAGTGALLQSQFLIHGFPPAPGLSVPGDIGSTVDPGVPLGGLRAQVGKVLEIVSSHYPRARVESLLLARRGALTYATLTIEGAAQPLTIDVATGNTISLPPAAPPPAGKLDLEIHQLAFEIHTGQLFDLPGEVMTLLCGLSLLFLAGSGLWLVVRMYRQRLRSGKAGLFWS